MKKSNKVRLLEKILSRDLKLLSDVAWQSSTGKLFQSFGTAAENELAPNVVSVFPLEWSNKSLPVDLRLYWWWIRFYTNETVH